MIRSPLGIVLVLLVLGALGLGLHRYLRRTGGGGLEAVMAGSHPGEPQPPPPEVMVEIGLGAGPALRTEKQPTRSPLYLAVDLRSPRGQAGMPTELRLGSEKTPWWEGLTIDVDGNPRPHAITRRGTPVFVASKGLGTAVSLTLSTGEFTEGLHVLVAHIDEGGHRYSSPPLPISFYEGERSRAIDRGIAAGHAVEAGRAREALELLGEQPLPRKHYADRAVRARALALLGRKKEALAAWDSLIADRWGDPRYREPPAAFMHERAELRASMENE